MFPALQRQRREGLCKFMTYTSRHTGKNSHFKKGKKQRYCPKLGTMMKVL